MFTQAMVSDCVHTTKVTRIKGKGWGIRLFLNGALQQQSTVKNRVDVSAEIGHMLRWEDKCGNISKMASSSRDRRFCSVKYKQKQAYKHPNDIT